MVEDTTQPVLQEYPKFGLLRERWAYSPAFMR